MARAIRFETSPDATPIHLVPTDELEQWTESQAASVGPWLRRALPAPKPGDWRFVPGEGDEVAVLAVVESAGREGLRALGALASALPEGVYALAGSWEPEALADAAWYWSGGTYAFGRYREPSRQPPVLAVPPSASSAEADITARDWVCDLINTPAGELGPDELAAEAETLASDFGAELRLVRGDELRRDYPMVAAVGQGAEKPPVLIDITWGDASKPKVTLVGKGVCFDSGGLDVKPAKAMRNMKKDMGGAAHALGLGRMIMARELPVRLRVLAPAVENAVSGSAYRPGDVLRSRKGLSVEIHNTDAEGRLVMADALADAAAESPDFLLDLATLTGAARVALGPELPALFTDDDEVASGLLESCREVGEPMWRMPLHRPYRSMLDSNVADISNAGASPHAGAITAALFLSEFAAGSPSWVHLDLFAWNESSKAGRPTGAEAQCLRGITGYLAGRFGR